MPAVPRPHRRGLALLCAAALAGGGLVGVVAWASSGCPGEPTDRALVADAPGSSSSRSPEHAAAAGRVDARVAAGLGAVGLRAEPRWALRQDGRAERDATFDSVAVADGLVVTLQRSTGRGGARADDVVAAYDAGTGADRWQLGWPATNGDGRLVPTPDGPLLVVVGGTTASLAGVDTGTGRVLWCADDGHQAARTSVLAGADRVLVAVQDGRDSHLRALDPSTGEERWRTDYEDHNQLVGPAVAGGVVVVHAVPDGGGTSLLHAYDLADGQLRWTAPADPPSLLAGGTAVALVAAHDHRADRDVVHALDPATGARRWAVPVPDAEVDGLDVLDAGVLVSTGPAGGPGALRLLDPTTGATRWSVADTGSGYRARPLRLTEPERVLRVGPERLTLVDAATGAVRSAPSDAIRVPAADLPGRVVVGSIGDDRVTVLTAAPDRTR